MEKTTDLQLLKNDSVNGNSSNEKESPQVRIVTINKRNLLLVLNGKGLITPSLHETGEGNRQRKGLDVVAIRHGIGIQAGLLHVVHQD